MVKKVILFKLIKFIRQYFEAEGFLDVLTPPIVANPGMETHIHPFGLYRAKGGENLNLFLHTSPEFHMKGLLSEGHEKIFTLSYCFRDEPSSQNHRPQFIMLEWYRAFSHYVDIMNDCDKLFQFLIFSFEKEGLPLRSSFAQAKIKRLTMTEAFDHFLQINLREILEKERLFHFIKSSHSDIPLPKYEEIDWEDLFFLLFLNKLEPLLINEPLLLLYEFPAQLCALSTIKMDDPQVCERFEIYAHGVELCNCFNELTSLHEQKKRFDQQRVQKALLYQYELPNPDFFFQSLERGLPQSSGIALGIERLAMAISGNEDLFY